MEEQMRTPSEVAQLLNVTRRTVYAWIHDRKLAVVKIGTRVRIEASVLARFIEAHRQSAA